MLEVAEPANFLPYFFKDFSLQCIYCTNNMKIVRSIHGSICKQLERKAKERNGAGLEYLPPLLPLKNHSYPSHPVGYSIYRLGYSMYLQDVKHQFIESTAYVITLNIWDTFRER